MPACGVPAGEAPVARGAASNSDFPAASAALRRADAIGSAMGLRGCQGYCLDGSDPSPSCAEFSAPETGESGMYSSSAASTTSGCGAGSASSTKAEAPADGGVAIGCGGRTGVGTNCCAADVGAATLGVAVVGLAACPLRNRPRATRSVPLDCST